MPQHRNSRARLKKVLICEVIAIVLLTTWLWLSGGFADLFRKDGEGAEPTAGRLTMVCLANGKIVLGSNDELVCGNLGTSVQSDDAESQVQAIRLKDETRETGENSYQAIMDNLGDGTIAVVLEDSEEMFKYVRIISDSAYTLRAYYQGKKLQVDATDLTLAENALVRLGAPNRNRSDMGEGARLVEKAKKERKNQIAVYRVQRYFEKLSRKGYFAALYDFEDDNGEAPEVVFGIDENSKTNLGSGYKSIVDEQGPLTNYAGEKLYLAVATVPRPDLVVAEAVPNNQVLVHYYAQCASGTVVPMDELNNDGYPRFAVTFPKVSGEEFYCVSGKAE